MSSNIFSINYIRKNFSNTEIQQLYNNGTIKSFGYDFSAWYISDCFLERLKHCYDFLPSFSLPGALTALWVYGFLPEAPRPITSVYYNKLPQLSSSSKEKVIFHKIIFTNSNVKRFGKFEITSPGKTFVDSCDILRNMSPITHKYKFLLNVLNNFHTEYCEEIRLFMNSLQRVNCSNYKLINGFYNSVFII